MPTSLVTGASSGFGRVTVLRLLREGWTVLATVRRDADAEALEREARAQGGHAGSGGLRTLLCDVTVAGDVARLGRETLAAAPALDALVNNAGTAWPGPLELLPVDDFRAQLEVNVVGQLAVTQAVLPALLAARGTIVNVSSVGGRRVLPVLGAYAASKFALEAMSDALRLELAPFGVRVVVVEPGGGRTAIWRTSVARRGALDGHPRAGAYAPLTETMTRHARRLESEGFAPEAFAGLVHHILTRDRPKPRYTLGPGARLTVALSRLLPDRMSDWLIRRRLGW